MKLFGAIAVYVEAEDILRAPGFFEKIKRAFGGKPDLRTGRVRAALEATAVVEATRDALRRIGVTNAISLVVDDTVLFQDKDGRPDDLGDLMVAFYENESVFGQGFRELRLAVEHHEAGLHLVLELQARPEHPKNAAAVRVLISGRIEALTPRPGEDAESYRRRAEPIATDAKALETYRLQFTAFVDRVRDALAAAMPTARVEVEVAEPRIVRPDGKPAEPQQPDARYYDPYDYYYYNSPAAIMADAFMWSAMFSMMSPPHYVVVDHGNHVQGHTDDAGIQDGPTDTSSADADTGNWWDGDAAAHESDTVAEPGGADPGADSGGSWWDDVGGGGDGGDGGGFDGGDFGGSD
jgi:hypothetical protein